MNHQIIVKNGEERPEVDELLHSFFQAQVPHPWPMLRLPSAPRARRVGSFWAHYSGRLSLAACVALLVAGYLTLAGFFPSQPTPNGTEQVIPPIGQGPKHSVKAPMHQPVATPRTEENADERPMLLPMPMHTPGKKAR